MMRVHLHRFSCLILAFGLALSGADRAIATEAAMRAGGMEQIVICGSTGPELITLDADGNPISPGRTKSCDRCPDCTNVSASSMISPFLVPPLDQVWHRYGRLIKPWPAPWFAQTKPFARGPPNEVL